MCSRPCCRIRPESAPRLPALARRTLALMEWVLRQHPRLVSGRRQDWNRRASWRQLRTHHSPTHHSRKLPRRHTAFEQWKTTLVSSLQTCHSCQRHRTMSCCPRHRRKWQHHCSVSRRGSYSSHLRRRRSTLASVPSYPMLGSDRRRCLQIVGVYVHRQSSHRALLMWQSLSRCVLGKALWNW